MSTPEHRSKLDSRRGGLRMLFLVAVGVLALAFEARAQDARSQDGQQTGSVLALCVTVVIALLWLGDRRRMRRIRATLRQDCNARLAERTRVARELHDSLLQGLLSSSMQLHIAIEHLPEDSPARPRLEHVQELMLQVIEEGRLALRSLHSAAGPFDDLELARNTLASEQPRVH